MPSTQLVWFKRDLRLLDHRPLTTAAAAGPVLALYVYEPELLASPEWDSSHSRFIDQCLAQLEAGITVRGGLLLYRVGRMPDVLDRLFAEHPFCALHSHRETGNALTYQRDLRVAQWCRQHRIHWCQTPQDGVIRRLRSRTGWARRWQQRMDEPIATPPDRIQPPPDPPPCEHRRTLAELGLPETRKTTQPGGSSHAADLLASFLNHRGETYRTGMSSPVHAFDACSRLSPHLAWGSISMRQVHQATVRRISDLRLSQLSGSQVNGRWFGSLASFAGRLRWHCHFMQKLEDEPRIEFENMARACDGLREDHFSQSRFDSWAHGQTGYPMVDACMRALLAGSWINFRMRAMLVSFASHHLWLHWRPTAVYLARHFLDFEPGIHFSQFQMQSATTGINTVRIYSPARQVLDHDPTGRFIRPWVPELHAVPDEHLAEPWKMPLHIQHACGCIIGKHYPAPIVEHAQAVQLAKQRIYAIRSTPSARSEADSIQQKHGSRRSGIAHRGQRTATPSPTGPRKRSAPRAPTGPLLFDGLDDLPATLHPRPAT